jgi:hypothetical protein
LFVAPKALAVGLTADAVGLSILDARRMALDPDTKGKGEVKRLFVGEPELAC